MRRLLPTLAAIAVIWLLYVAKANVWFRLYPVIVVGCFLVLFSVSLFRTPLVEVFARKMGETLDERGVAYCRRVTLAWVVFLSVHLAVTVATLFMSREVWAVYNGLIAYILMGAMFAGEWIIRRRVKRG